MNFILALRIVHWPQEFRHWRPAIVLVFLGLHVGLRGGRRCSLDALLFRDGGERSRE